MLELLLTYSFVCLLMVPLGAITVKLSYWGIAIYSAYAGSYLMLDSKDAGEVWMTGLDSIIQMWMFAPYLVNDMVGQGAASGDPLTLIIYSLVGFLPIIPYSVGVGLGLLYFPDLYWAAFVWTLLFRAIV